MAIQTVKSSVRVTTASIEKKFTSFKPIEALYELIWNGLDAGATRVEVKIKNNALETVNEILIFDNGSGIDFGNDSCGFYNYDDSEKKYSQYTHGKDGVGRFGFHKICSKAEWFTKINGRMYKTCIDASNLPDFDTIEIESNEVEYLNTLVSGTVVRLTRFENKKNLPLEQDIIRFLSIEFGWYLAIKKNIEIIFNGNKVEMPRVDIVSRKFEVDGHYFDTKFYRWFDKPSSEKSYDYFLTTKGRIKLRELSGFNRKPNFYLSTVVESEVFDNYEVAFKDMDTSFLEWRNLKNEIALKQREIYLKFLKLKADEVVSLYVEKGFFPITTTIDKEYNNWRNYNIKTVVKELYINDPTLFNSLKDKPAQILIRLLDKIIVSNENDALFSVLEGVLDLEQDGLDRLSKIIKDSTLDNIISTVEEIIKRLSVVKMIKEIMVHKYHDILETPDLQKVIENNSWLFGEQYTLIGSEEDDFNRLARNLRNEVKGINEISIDDLEEGVSIEGAKRQVDFFLASKKMSHDESNRQIFKCIIIEIKKPSISLNIKHLRQLEDYADIISKHPSFSSNKMRFELVLIGRKISQTDTAIRSKLESAKIHQENGLINKDTKIKTYIRDWFSILDEHELSQNYLLDKLKPRLPDYNDVQPRALIKELQK